MTDDETRIPDVFVANVMTKSVATIAADATAQRAADHLSAAEIGSLLVDPWPVPPTGIITESGFVDLVANERDPATTTVAECMSSPVITTTPSTSIGVVADQMADHHIKKLPVIDETEDVLAGIVTTSDIAKYVPIHEFHPADTV